MNTYSKIGLCLFVASTLGCSKSYVVVKESNDPSYRAKIYNYNENSAKAVINYTQKHRKHRQRVAEYTRKVNSEKLMKMNGNHEGSIQEDRTFKIYSTN